MSRYSSKTALLEGVYQEYMRLEADLSQINDEEQCSPAADGQWSVKDTLAHLGDWQKRFMGWYQAGKRGETVQIPAPGFSWNQLDDLNKQTYDKYKDQPLNEVRSMFEESYQQMLSLIEELTDEELFTPGAYAWTGNDLLMDWLDANTANHYAGHDFGKK